MNKATGEADGVLQHVLWAADILFYGYLAIASACFIAARVLARPSAAVQLDRIAMVSFCIATLCLGTQLLGMAIIRLRRRP